MAIRRPRRSITTMLALERRRTLSRKLKNMSCCEPTQTDNRYRRILWAALAVNLTMFGVELVASIIGRSVSLRGRARFSCRRRKLYRCSCRGWLGAPVARAGGSA